MDAVKEVTHTKAEMRLSRPHTDMLLVHLAILGAVVLIVAGLLIFSRSQLFTEKRTFVLHEPDGR